MINIHANGSLSVVSEITFDGGDGDKKRVWRVSLITRGDALEEENETRDTLKVGPIGSPLFCHYCLSLTRLWLFMRR